MYVYIYLCTNNVETEIYKVKFYYKLTFLLCFFCLIILIINIFIVLHDMMYSEKCLLVYLLTKYTKHRLYILPNMKID